MTDEEITTKQLKFVEWLKEKGLYNPMESSHNMQLMQKVWEATTDGKEVVTFDYEELLPQGKEFV